MVTLLLVLVGGAAGAIGRFLVDRATTIPGSSLPLGTFTVNVAGSLLLGLVAGAAGGLPGWVGPLVGTGFCGALTTYSTFGYETTRLTAVGSAGRGWAMLNVVATLAVGLGAVGLGRLLASTV